MNAAKLGALIGVLLIVALVNDWSVPDRLIIILAVALLVCWIWSRFSLQRLGFERSLSVDRVRAGDWINENLTLRNHSVMPKLWIEVKDLSSLPDHLASQAVSIGSRGESSWTVNTRCEHRGVYRLGPVTAQSGDPLGLFNQRRMIPATHEIVVYPPVVDVSDVPMPRANMTGGNTAKNRAALTAHQVASVREYAPGDPMSRISWSATARMGHMMVKELDPEPTADIWVLLDFNDLESNVEPSDFHARYQERQRFHESIEYAVAVAGSLAESSLHEGRKVGFLLNRGMPIRIDGDASQGQWMRIFESLAVATPFGQRSLFEAIQADTSRFSRNSGLIVVTTRTSPDWVTAAQSLVMRQVPVTAVLIAHRDELTDGKMEGLALALASAHVQIVTMAPGERIGSSVSSVHQRTT